MMQTNPVSPQRERVARALAAQDLRETHEATDLQYTEAQDAECVDKSWRDWLDSADVAIAAMVQNTTVPSEAALDALVTALNDPERYVDGWLHEDNVCIMAEAAAAITALRKREKRLRDIGLAETLAHHAWDAVERQGAKGPCVCDMNYAQAAEEIQAEIIAILGVPSPRP